LRDHRETVKDMASEHFDVVVIGAGMGGISAAGLAAQRGAKVAIIEGGQLGGTCLNVGCIPAKSLVASAEAIHTARRGEEFGFHVTGLEPDWARAVARKNAIVAMIRGMLEQQFAGDRGPRLFRGWALFQSNASLSVNGQDIEADKVIVATGATLAIPELPGLRDANYLTNETVMDLPELPESLIIIGGGPEAMEFGQIFQRFSTRVTVLQRRDRVLPREDAEISRGVEAFLHEEGVEIRTQTTPLTVEGRSGENVIVRVQVDGHTEAVRATHLLLATGRRPRSPRELGLDVAGVAADARGGIQVDRALKTTAPNIWAIGDVLGRAQYTHFAVYTSGLVIASALDGTDVAVDERRKPSWR
jgi:pyruvate/2-oxoglutarate dehydrogenase complex dihydrolipoamide dehydrogenase (E3) component